VQQREGSWIPDPLYGLPVGDHPYVIHRDDRIEERYEAFLVMRLGEPCSVVEQTEGRPVSAEGRIQLSLCPFREQSFQRSRYDND